MTRGNQRDIDRQRAQNRHAKKGVGDVREGSAQQRRVSVYSVSIYAKDVPRQLLSSFN